MRRSRALAGHRSSLVAVLAMVLAAAGILTAPAATLADSDPGRGEGEHHLPP